MRIRPLTASAALAAGALLLTACGDSRPLEGQTGPEVAESAAAALEEAGAVHLSGTLTEDGEETAIDLQLQGDDAAGSITVAEAELELISVDGDVYIEATPDFLAPFGLSADEVEQYEGRWVVLPDEASESFADFSLAGFIEELRSPSGEEYGEETRNDELDGEPVVIVEHEDGSTLTVADDDPAYPLRITGPDGAEGAVTFSNHGEEEDISAPEDVLDLEEITGG